MFTHNESKNKKELVKFMKKKLSLLLVLTLVFAMLASCAKPAVNNPPVPSDDNVSAPATSDAPADKETPAEPEAEPAPDNGVDTVILKEADDKMINTYTVIAVDPEAPFTDVDGNAVSGVAVNTAGADAFIDWLLSAEASELIAKYGEADFGDSLFYLKDGAPRYEGTIAPAQEATKTIRLSTTTSVKDSGLLDNLIPVFQDKYGYTVEVQSAGTGKAIAAAKYGNADLILVHSKSQEETFVSEGFARIPAGFEAERLSFMYNYFVLCGPKADPAGAGKAESVLDAFASIANGKFTFISRGDKSGTHTKELSLWPAELGITADAESFVDYTEWYVSANTGMGACLVMAEEQEGYILTDKATYLTFYKNGGKI